MEDVDVSDKPQVALYVRCRSIHSQGETHMLHLDVLEGMNAWQIEVKESDKPAVLACSAAEYLRVLETTFTSDANARFQFQWSRKKTQLTLVERTGSGIAMTYTRLKLRALLIESGQYWSDMLHAIGAQYGETQCTVAQQSERIEELEELLKAKDCVVETALQAKQKLEDELFAGFCTVLNTKKETILRLQIELQEAKSFPSAVASKSRSKAPRKPKAKGAKLRKKEVASDEDEEELSGADNQSVEENEVSDGESESNSTGPDSDGSNLKDKKHRSRVQQDAVDVYGALPKHLRKSTQICSANDVLDDIDLIMKQEVEANNKEVAGQETQGNGTRKRPPPTSPTRQQGKKIKQEEPIQEPSPPPKAPARKPPAKRAAAKKKPSPMKAKKTTMSDEEDILDMLA